MADSTGSPRTPARCRPACARTVDVASILEADIRHRRRGFGQDVSADRAVKQVPLGVWKIPGILERGYSHRLTIG